MNPHKETYEGCRIEISDKEILTVNAKQIDYEFDPTQKKWSSRYLPYSRYDSLVELARAVAGNTEEFKTLSE